MRKMTSNFVFAPRSAHVRDKTWRKETIFKIVSGRINVSIIDVSKYQLLMRKGSGLIAILDIGLSHTDWICNYRIWFVLWCPIIKSIVISIHRGKIFSYHISILLLNSIYLPIDSKLVLSVLLEVVVVAVILFPENRRDLGTSLDDMKGDITESTVRERRIWPPNLVSVVWSLNSVRRLELDNCFGSCGTTILGRLEV